jgi:hypothetical protein
MSAYHKPICGVAQPDAVEELSSLLLLTPPRSNAMRISPLHLRHQLAICGGLDLRKTQQVLHYYAGPCEGFAMCGTAACYSNQRSTATNRAKAFAQPLAPGSGWSVPSDYSRSTGANKKLWM